MLAVMGWHPDPNHRAKKVAAPEISMQANQSIGAPALP
jgi:hypothetical protein